MPLPFVKAEGTGNDFVVVDLRRDGGAPPAQAIQDPAVVRQICDRHFGVGADGVLAILPSASGDARMRVLNADGSEAEMCGNGLRCVAKVLYESDPALRRPTLNIETGAGVLACTLDVAGGAVRDVAEEMGRPRLTRSEIPLSPAGSERALREPIRARDREFRFTAVSMGNPHAVIFVEGDDDLRALAETYGPTLEVADRFPRRTNVEFARVRGQRNRSGRLGARQRPHARLRHRRLRHRRGRLPGGAPRARRRDAGPPARRHAGHHRRRRLFGRPPARPRPHRLHRRPERRPASGPLRKHAEDARTPV